MKARDNRKKGFTLIELLGTISIIIVLFGLSVPAVNGLKTRLEMMKLNGIAKEIYVASQNRTIHLRSASSLGGLESALDNSGEQRNVKARFDKEPGDYDSSRIKNWESLYYIVSGDTFDSYVMPDTASKIVANGCYVIETDPRTGDVYSVMYTENEPDSLKSLYEETLYGDREEATFKNNRVGYYCAYTDGVATGNSMFTPIITAHNGEELYLDLRIAEGTVLTNKVSFNVTLKDKGKGVCDLTLSDADYTDFYGGQLLLDSLTGDSFETVTGGKLKLGDDITATAVAEYTYGKYIQTDVECMTNVATFNSLFDEGTNADSIKVSRVRHLENLNTIYDNELTTDKLADRVVQTADIDFAKTLVELKNAGDVTANCSGVPINFSPVSNATLFGSVLEDGGNSYDGKGNELINFNIDSLGSRVGIFSATSCNLYDIHIKAARVKGQDNVGALVGLATGGTIDRCGSFVGCIDKGSLDVNTCSVAGTKNVGGLIGATNGSTTVKNSFGAVNATGSNNIGGLVGLNKAVISNCYSSGDVKATGSFAGGIAGLSNSSTNAIENCYSTSNVYSAVNASGIAGAPSDSEAIIINNCKYYGAVTGGSSVDVISCGKITGSSNTYLTMTDYNAGTDINDHAAAAKGYSDLSVTGNTRHYSHPYISALEGAFPFGFISTIKYHYGNWPIDVGGDVSDPKLKVVYYEKYSDDSYGFYSLVKNEDGTYSEVVNTLKSQGSTDGINAEPYLVEDGYALMLKDGTINSLGGSMTVTTPNNTKTTFKKIGVNSSVGTGNCEALTQTRIGGINYHACAFWQGLQQFDRKGDSTGFYDKVHIDVKVTGDTYSYDFCFNPHFAKAAINLLDQSSAVPKSPLNHTVYVRSARQLYNLGYYSEYSGMINSDKMNYSQELDIDFSKYVSKYRGANFTMNCVPIGKTGTFTNNYDGHGYEIFDYKLTTTDSTYTNVGMFGSIANSELKNIHMVASDPLRSGGSTGYVKTTFACTTMMGSESNCKTMIVGGLVGLVSDAGSSVSNCSISGFDIAALKSGSNNYQKKPIAVGGLIGCSIGNVTKCTSVNHTVELSTAYITTSGGVGGLMGSKYGGTLENCYAGGILTLSSSAYSNNGTVGGVAGSSIPVTSGGDGDKNATNCYSYCTVDDTDGDTAVYGCNKNAIECYYLNDNDDSANSYIGHKISVTSATDDDEGTNIRCTTDGLANIENEGFGYDVSDSFPWSMSGEYSFRPVIRSGDGYDDAGSKYVHYGDWPTKNIASPIPGKVGIIRANDYGWGITATPTAYYNFGVASSSRGLSATGMGDFANKLDYHDFAYGSYYAFWNVDDPENWSITTYRRDTWISSWKKIDEYSVARGELTESKGVLPQKPNYIARGNLIESFLYKTEFTYYGADGKTATASIIYQWASMNTQAGSIFGGITTGTAKSLMSAPKASGSAKLPDATEPEQIEKTEGSEQTGKTENESTDDE